MPFTIMIMIVMLLVGTKPRTETNLHLLLFSCNFYLMQIWYNVYGGNF